MYPSSPSAARSPSVSPPSSVPSLSLLHVTDQVKSSFVSFVVLRILFLPGLYRGKRFREDALHFRRRCRLQRAAGEADGVGEAQAADDLLAGGERGRRRAVIAPRQ